ncbi:MAG: peptide deformylase [Acetobacteraceae bacterium]|nr:peptide deformylase [Acetobacteraceae bacterium]
MALLKIARIGHPVLRQVAEPVADPLAPDIRRLIADMAETMQDAGGIGLAAPQVHLPLRLFVWRGADGVRALINPEILPLHGGEETSWEGCLSIPGLRGPVTRPASVTFRGLDENGEPTEGEATGLAARVLQHENDHLDGIIYLMRMNDLAMLGYQEELARAAERAA